MQAFTAFIELVSKGIGKFQADISSARSALTHTQGDADKLNQKVKGVGNAGDEASRKLKKIDGGFFSAAAKQAEALAAKLRTAQAVGAGGSMFQGWHYAIRKVESQATRSFVVMGGAIAGFLKLAAPTELMYFTGALLKIGVNLGSIFIPLLRSATNHLNQFLEIVRNLTSEQKSHILSIAKWTLGLLGGVVVATRLITLLRVMSVAFNGLGNALWAVIAASPLAILVGAAVAIGALVVGVGGLSSALSNQEGKIASVADLWNAMKETLLKFWAFIKPFAETFWNALKKVGAAATDVFIAIKPALDKVVDAFGLVGSTIFGIVIGALETLAGWIRKPEFHVALVQFAEKAAVALTALASVLQFVGGMFLKMSETLGTELLAAFEVVGNAIRGLANWWNNLSGSAKASIAHLIKVGLTLLTIRYAFNLLLPIITTVITAFQALRVAMIGLGLSNPVGWILLAVAALAYFVVAMRDTSTEADGQSSILQSLSNAWEKFAGIISKIGQVLAPAFKAFKDFVNSVMDDFDNALDDMKNKNKETANEMKDDWGGFSKNLGTVFENAFSFIKGGIDSLTKQFSALLTIYQDVSSGVFNPKTILSDIKRATAEIDAVTANWAKRSEEKRQKKEAEIAAERLATTMAVGAAGAEAVGGKGGEKKDENFAPLPRQENPQFSSVVEFLRKAQGATAYDPLKDAALEQNRIGKKQVEQNDKTNELLDDIMNRGLIL